MSDTHAMHEPAPPWYRQRWPWLLMLMPALAVVGGFITLWLALTTNNAMVVDDYYREGKAINLELARDRTAAVRGLEATLAEVDGRLTVRIKVGEGVLPASLNLRIVHATRVELDRAYTLPVVGPGLYADPEARLPGPGRWRVLLEDPGRSWRLTALAQGFAEPVRLRAAD